MESRSRAPTRPMIRFSSDVIPLTISTTLSLPPAARPDGTAQPNQGRAKGKALQNVTPATKTDIHHDDDFPPAAATMCSIT